MAALFPKIYDVIASNPTKQTTLRWRTPAATEGSGPETWDSFFVSPLQPPGALSLCLLHTDPLFELASESLRKQLLTETLLKFQTRAEVELVGRRFPRKKIQDLLAGQLSAEAPKSSPLLEEVVCELGSFQKILLNRRSKTIVFSPSDPRVWSLAKPIVVGEEDNCWSFRPTQTLSLREWLIQKEEEGWTVEWPTADGKLDELKAMWVSLTHAADSKHKKDDLARLVGRLLSLRALSTFELTPTPVNLELS